MTILISACYYYYYHLYYRYCLWYSVSEIVGLALQFATQNCLGCYSKFNLGSKFHAEVAIHFLYAKLKTLYTLNIILL